MGAVTVIGLFKRVVHGWRLGMKGLVVMGFESMTKPTKLTGHLLRFK